MNSKVVVVFVKHTGHVLAAMTRTADAEDKADLEQIVDPALKVRCLASEATLGGPTGLVFDIPKDQLGTMVTDEIPDLLAKPRTFRLADPTNQNSTLEKLPIANSASAPTDGRVVDPPTLSPNQIRVVIEYPIATGPPSDKTTPVWAMIRRDADNVQFVAGEINKNANTVDIPLLVPVPVGEHRDVLVFAGHSAIYAKHL